jgi:hypothetical protein
MTTLSLRRNVLGFACALGATVTMGVLACKPAQADCYRPAGPQAMGWKRVALPADAPALAADSDIAQLRTGEPAWLTEPWHYEGAFLDRQHVGKTEYSFSLTPSTRGEFQLYFVESLAGSKVDVWAYTNSGTLWLWKERRIGDNEVQVRWDGPRVATVVVRVHHHLRGEPPVQRFRLIREMQPVEQSWLPSEFRVPRSLYYYQPAGRELTLCDAQGRQLTVEQELIAKAGAPQATTVRRAP